MKRFADFDAVFARLDTPTAEPIRIKLFQAVWELPGNVAPHVIVRLWSMLGEGRVAATRGELVELLTDLVPMDIIDAWLALGITFEQLTDVLVYVADCYVDAD